MRQRTLVAALIVVALALVALSGAALLAGAAKPRDDAGPATPDEISSPLPSKGWSACPTPPCMAPCVLGQKPEVLCKDPGGSVTKTTYFCCCCGSGDSQFKPL